MDNPEFTDEHKDNEIDKKLAEQAEMERLSFTRKSIKNFKTLEQLLEENK
nr:hypothetical protein [Morganella morganii]